MRRRSNRWHWFASLVVALSTLVGALGSSAGVALAADTSYTSCPDPVTFHDDLASVTSGSATFTFPPGCTLKLDQTLQIAAGVNITITGNGLTLDGQDQNFDIITVNDTPSAPSHLTLTDVTVTHGQNGISEHGGGTVTLTGSTITQNDGIGIDASGVDGTNGSDGADGANGTDENPLGEAGEPGGDGGDGTPGGSITLVNSTVSNNGGGGIVARGGHGGNGGAGGEGGESGGDFSHLSTGGDGGAGGTGGAGGAGGSVSLTESNVIGNRGIGIDSRGGDGGAGGSGGSGDLGDPSGIGGAGAQGGAGGAGGAISLTESNVNGNKAIGLDGSGGDGGAGGSGGASGAGEPAGNSGDGGSGGSGGAGSFITVTQSTVSDNGAGGIIALGGSGGDGAPGGDVELIVVGGAGGAGGRGGAGGDISLIESSVTGNSGTGIDGSGSRGGDGGMGGTGGEARPDGTGGTGGAGGTGGEGGLTVSSTGGPGGSGGAGGTGGIGGASNHITLTNSTLSTNGASGIVALGGTGGAGGAGGTGGTGGENESATGGTGGSGGTGGDGNAGGAGGIVTLTLSTLTNNATGGIATRGGDGGSGGNGGDPGAGGSGDTNGSNGTGGVDGDGSTGGHPGLLTLTGTILAANGTNQNCVSGDLTDNGYNRSTDASCAFNATGSQANVDPSTLDLGMLGDYGGPTETIPLLVGSIAINAIPASQTACFDANNSPIVDPITGDPITTDQRGVTRPQGEQCDIGAYEVVPLTTSTVVTPVTIDPTVTSVTLSATVTVSTCPLPDNDCGTVNQGSVTFQFFDANHTPIGTPVSGPVSDGSASASWSVPSNLPPGDYTIVASYHDPSGFYGDSQGTSTLTVTAPASTPRAFLEIINPFSSRFAPLAVAFTWTGASGGTPSGALFYVSPSVSLTQVHLSSLVVHGTSATLYGEAQLVDGPRVNFQLEATARLGALFGQVELRLSNGYDSGPVSVLAVLIRS